jgi:hypothetical protein
MINLLRTYIYLTLTQLERDQLMLKIESVRNGKSLDDIENIDNDQVSVTTYIYALKRFMLTILYHLRKTCLCSGESCLTESQVQSSLFVFAGGKFASVYPFPRPHLCVTFTWETPKLGLPLYTV